MQLSSAERICLSSSAKADDVVISGGGDLRIEVVPIRILHFNELYFPRSIPFLQSFFAADGCLDVRVLFEINEAMDAVTFGEAWHRPHPVLVDPANQIIGHSDIEGPADFAGENVDPVVAFGAYAQDAVFTGSSAFADDDNHSK
jgi:hypothetical protein